MYNYLLIRLNYWIGITYVCLFLTTLYFEYSNIYAQTHHDEWTFGSVYKERDSHLSFIQYGTTVNFIRIIVNPNTLNKNSCIFELSGIIRVFGLLSLSLILINCVAQYIDVPVPVSVLTPSTKSTIRKSKSLDENIKINKIILVNKSNSLNIIFTDTDTDTDADTNPPNIPHIVLYPILCQLTFFIVCVEITIVTNMGLFLPTPYFFYECNYKGYRDYIVRDDDITMYWATTTDLNYVNILKCKDSFSLDYIPLDHTINIFASLSFVASCYFLGRTSWQFIANCISWGIFTQVGLNMLDDHMNYQSHTGGLVLCICIGTICSCLFHHELSLFF